MPSRDEIHILAVQKNDINLFLEPVRDEILCRVPRVVGNRRTDEELSEIQFLQNKQEYKLDEQENFNGSDEQLEYMQKLELSYIDGKPLVSDEEWDYLKNKYNYSESLYPGSPSGRTWSKMLAPLPSIDKAGSPEDVLKFLSNFDNEQKFQVECKLDGLAANVRYKLIERDYWLCGITSRGNGRYGLNVNDHALDGVLTNFSHIINADDIDKILAKYGIEESPEYIELRGEAVVPKNPDTFKKYGKDSTWRSIAAGIFNRKVPANVQGLAEYLGIRDELRSSKGYHQIEYKEQAKLFASLSKHTYSPRAKDKVFVDYYNQAVKIVNKDGKELVDHIIPEYLDIVFYSMAINGSNIDDYDIKNIAGIKHISEVNFEFDFDGKSKKTFIITDNRYMIVRKIDEFYGHDIDNHKLDMNLPRLRNLYEYACDGVVIKPVGSDKTTQNVDFRLAKNSNKIVCPKYPEDQIACKYLSEVVNVKLVKIVNNKTDLGNVTCSGILDKAYTTESGAKVSTINLHNPEWLEKNDWIKPGNNYDMIMSLDIIPVLIKPDKIEEDLDD